MFRALTNLLHLRLNRYRVFSRVVGQSPRVLYLSHYFRRLGVQWNSLDNDAGIYGGVETIRLLGYVGGSIDLGNRLRAFPSGFLYLKRTIFRGVGNDHSNKHGGSRRRDFRVPRFRR